MSRFNTTWSRCQEDMLYQSELMSIKNEQIRCRTYSRKCRYAWGKSRFVAWRHVESWQCNAAAVWARLVSDMFEPFDVRGEINR